MNSSNKEYKASFTNQKVLVTGATGFIGMHLVDALVALGAEVHGITRNIPRPFKKIHYWCCDINDVSTLSDTIGKIEPDIIYHLAGIVTAQQNVELVNPMLQTNLIGTVNLLLLAHHIGCQRVIVAGSSEEQGLASGIPGSPYAAAKLAATQYTQMFYQLYNFPVVIARLFMNYGPGQSPQKLLPYLIQTLFQGESPILSDGMRSCDFIYVADTVRGLLALGKQPDVEGKIIDLGSGVGVTIREVVDLLAELIDCSISPTYGNRQGRIGERPQIANLIATKQHLKWEPQSPLRQGIAKTIEFYIDG